MNWDEKFTNNAFTYGKEPNDFLVSVADRIPAGGKVLTLCEGEGRNGVYLAGLGHRVFAVDGSAVGLNHARELAAERGVNIETQVSDLADYEIEPDSWDAVVMIFGHLPLALRKRVNSKIVNGLRSGGVLIIEGYTPRQLAYNTGGPKDVNMLYEPEVVKTELEGLKFEIAREIEREIIEGPGHTGVGAVFQLLGRK
jgi:SAM-dependent methyltransferase